MRFSILKIVFLKELREMLRDRRSLMVMFGLPLVLYPLMTIGIASVGTSRQTELMEKVPRVVVLNGGEAPELLREMSQKDGGVELMESSDPKGDLARERVGAVLEVPSGYEKKSLAGEDVELKISVDRSKSEAGFTEEKLRHVLRGYQDWLIGKRLAKYGAPMAAVKPIKTVFTDVATADQRMGKMLAMMLPLLLLMTGMLGALFPALHATTMERELGTLETLLVTPATRKELLIAKGGLVLLSGLLTAGLNMVSMSLVLWKVASGIEGATRAAGGLGALQIDPGALVLTYIAAVPGILFFATIVLIVGMVARNFREANSFATPVMLLPIVAVLVNLAEPRMTTALLCTPVVSTTLIIREVLTGHVGVRPYLLAFVSSCVYAGLMISAAGRMFTNEQLVNPSWEAVSWGVFKRGTGKRRRGLPAMDGAIALCCVSTLLLLYLTPGVGRIGFLGVVTLSQIAFIALPALGLAWLAGWDWVKTFSWRPARWTELAGAVLIGLGIGPVVQLLGGLQNTFWPEEPQMAGMNARLFLGAVRDAPILVPLVVGVLAGLCEETLFRGPMQTAMVKRLGRWPGLVVVAMAFALAHLDIHGVPLRGGIGLVLGWMVVRTGSVFPAMIAHGVYDGTQLALASWVVHKEGYEAALAQTVGHGATAGEVMQGEGARAVVGLVVAVAGVWMIGWFWRREAPIDAKIPAEVS